MKKNSLLKHEDNIIRILDINAEKVLIIDCIKRTMPKWVETTMLSEYIDCSEEELLIQTGIAIMSEEDLDSTSRRFIHEHFTLIANILPFISDVTERNLMIVKVTDEKKVSRKTVCNYLCLYLAYQNTLVFAPKVNNKKKELSPDEKNMRWALNKYFYTRQKNSISTVYTLMLKEKYCDNHGQLLPVYPSIHQFRYFYRKNRKMQTYYISRDGLKDYQRNNRPLLGDRIQQFAPCVGTGMLDATICDIYLVNDTGGLVGRPILTVCIDAYSSLCCGYALTWEGGMYSLKSLLSNIITDKVEWCHKFGIMIQRDEWNCNQLPSTLVTDMGAEYKSGIFEQISELGVTLINLPPYRPELKGGVEKFFDLIQETYKKHLKGRGVIEPDFQERGVHDYRKDACLTMKEFEKIILHCILYYNNQRIIERFPYTEEMFEKKIQPYANKIWEYGRLLPYANLISVSAEKLYLTLLPRINGKFTRYGLSVNRMRYHCDGYTEKYLSGGIVMVAYNPENVSYVWLIEKSEYVCFKLIENRFMSKSLSEVQNLHRKQKELIKNEINANLQAKIDLTEKINIISKNVSSDKQTKIKDVRRNRKLERMRTHVDYLEGGVHCD